MKGCIGVGVKFVLAGTVSVLFGTLAVILFPVYAGMASETGDMSLANNWPLYLIFGLAFLLGLWAFLED